MCGKTGRASRYWWLGLALALALGCGDNGSGTAVGSPAQTQGGGGHGGGGGEGGGPIQRCTEPPALPDTLVYDGQASSIAVGDIDADGCSDIVALVAAGEPSYHRLLLEVAWGDPQGAFAERWRHTIKEVTPNPAGYPPAIGTRDSSSQVVDVALWDGDGFADVATAAGFVLGGANRELVWQPLEEEATSLPEGGIPMPATFAKIGGDALRLVYGTADGEVKTCGAPNDCVTLPHGGASFPITELVTGDFDHDGQADLLVGRDLEEDVGPPPDYTLLVGTWLWASSQQWAQPVQIMGMHVVDIETGDLNQDGFPDVVSQVREFISDFPSETELWLSRPGGFDKVQVFGNSDNHTDVMAVADVDGDDCPDRLFIGVDIPSISLVWGNCPTGFGAGGVYIDSPTGIGVQFLDVNGDGTSEIVLRNSDTGDLHFITAPARE